MDHRAAAIAAHNRTWDLLETPERDDAATAEMIEAAHASLWHWRQAGGDDVKLQRGEWLVVRVLCDAGLAQAALHRLGRTESLTRATPGLSEFDHAFAGALAARILAFSGDLATAAAALATATSLGTAIADPEDRAEFFRQLAAPPWFGLLVSGG